MRVTTAALPPAYRRAAQAARRRRAEVGGGGGPRTHKARAAAALDDRPDASPDLGRSEAFVGANGVEVHAVVTEASSGESAPPTVVLLHGFPGFHRDWRKQVRPLSEAGLRVVSLDMRGYGWSGKPKGVGNYQMPTLVADVEAAIKHFAPNGRARGIAGHDWGGGVAWSYALANTGTGSFERLAVLNLPHPKRFADAIRGDPSQMLKSWYIAAFQLPGVAEAVLTADDGALLRRLYGSEPRPPYPREEIDRYVAAFTPESAEAAINYYRAAVQFGGFGPKGAILRPPWEPEPVYRPITEPTLVLWGTDDAYLNTSMAEPPAALVPDCDVAYLAGASHWVMNDAADAVSARLASFFG